MAETKRPKLSLPTKSDSTPANSERRRPPLRGANKSRPPARPQPPAEPSRARAGEGRGRDGERSGFRRDGEGDDRKRGFGRAAPRPDGAPDTRRPRFDARREDGQREGRREGWNAGERSERPRRDFEGRPARDERPVFRREDDGRGDRGFRGERPPREGRSFGDRPPREREARPADGRREGRREGGWNAGERSERPRRDFEGRPERGERPAFRREDDARGDRGSRGERPPRENRSFGERPPREREARGFGEERCPRREGEERRGFGERPARDRDDTRGFKPRAEGERAPRRAPGERPPYWDDARPAADRRDGERRQPYAQRERTNFRRDEERGFREDRRPAPRSGDGRPARDFTDRPRFADDAAAPRGKSFSRAKPGLRQPAPPAHRAEPVVHEDAPGSMRLSKRMSELGLCSRREADEYIERGWVKVDGEVVCELGTKVTTDQKIALDVVAEEMQMRRVTILINKPIGYVSGQAEDGHEPAAVLITPDNHWSEDPTHRRFEGRIVRKLAPAGRLDIDSTGLLVLTQDGRIAKQLIGEYSEVEKEYLVRVEGQMRPDGLKLLNHGLELDGMELLPAKVSWQNEDQLRFVLHEGRKRQIRRMCELVGLKVVGLKRIRIGRIPLSKLPVGQWRYLGEHEEF
ncbi:MAG: hypothetical protein CGU28_10695 [Candidatus Dactylopiibacterium carminicum]|nr:MAG: hypothetical protein CGU28_10695 [Candidatus Dactylopiibacterium carminicum]